MKEEFIKNHIFGIEDFFKFMQNSFEYGWIDKNDIRHLGVNYGGMNCLQSPEQLIKTRLGICWDRTELCREYFNVHNYKNETYFIYYDDGKGCPSHTILVFYDKGKVYWFEPMFNDKIYYYSGIHEYDSLEILLKDLKRRFIENAVIMKFIPINYDTQKIYLFKYDKPKYGINGEQFYNHCKKGKRIRI